MKIPFVLVIIVSTLSVAGQKQTSSIALSENIKLIGEIEEFNAAKHNIDTCRNEFSDKYLCRIDGMKWFGTDQGLELPRTQLNSLSLIIDGKPTSLDVSGMFNPVFGYDLSLKRFKIIKKTGYYLLYGYFSDGAGTYTAHWKISNGRSSRLKISNDESDFSWQNI